MHSEIIVKDFGKDHWQKSYQEIADVDELYDLMKIMSQRLKSSIYYLRPIISLHLNAINDRILSLVDEEGNVK